MDPVLHEDVVRELPSDTLSLSAQGLNGYVNMLHLHFNYKMWLHFLLWWYCFCLKCLNPGQLGYFHDSRIGEAQNPGPAPYSRSPKMITCAVTNPTALVGKREQIQDLNADVLFLSEVSTTSYAQKNLQYEYQKVGMKCFWSAPVACKRETVDGRPSLRGEASGTAILTSLQSHSFRGSIDPIFWNTCRVSTCILKLGTLDIFAVAVYGVPENNSAQNRKTNDLLLAHILQLVAQVKLPFLIGGDFNSVISTLPLFSEFQAMGAVDIISYTEQTLQKSIGFTCRGATKNDTCIVHPSILPLVRNVRISDDPSFLPHSPLLFDLDLHIQPPQMFRWDTPKSWKVWSLTKEDIDKHYHFDNVDDVILNIHDQHDAESALQQWSHRVECAIDATLQQMHRDDPLTNPQKGLPAAFRGRCNPRKLVPVVHKHAVTQDKNGGYNPPVETFSECSKFKIRQTRRLFSLHKAILNWMSQFDGDISHMPYPQQCEGEWQKILRAPGYGKSWTKWILKFPEVHVVPSSQPCADDVFLFAQITKFDSDAFAQQEVSNRQKLFKQKIQIDNSDDFGKMTYRIMRNCHQASLDEVPYDVSSSATLLRSTKGLIKLKVLHPQGFLEARHAAFGEAEIFIRSIEHSVFTIEIISGVIPAAALLKQTFVATTPDQIGHLFNEFWSRYWMRDDSHEQFSPDSWEDFLTDMDTISFPDIHCDVIIDDPDMWYDVIQQLPHGKAEGCCGWRYEELKLLPKSAICHVVKIFAKLWSFGFSDNLMKARAVLLAKTQQPKSINDTRPITILSCLYRLASRVVFLQVSRTWASFLPPGISGGMPCRGVRDMTMSQGIQLEHAIGNKVALTGSSMDLVKAFNLIPRYAARWLMRRLGISDHILDFWHMSISRMTRLPALKTFLLDEVPSTTGLPEGDSWSVLGMISLSCAFYYKIASPRLQPYCYADNWSWIAKSVRDQMAAWISTLNLIQSLRMSISIPKSWCWALHKDQKAILHSLNLLFPSGDSQLTILEHTKDLGEIVQYNKKPFSSPLLERLKQMRERIAKLMHLPIPLQTKAQRIQAGAYPFGLYGADSHYVGQEHFDKIRRSVADTLTGRQTKCSSYLACRVLSPHVQDPFVYVVCNALRNLRRLACKCMNQARDFLQMATSFTGALPFGPASTLRRYLDKMNLTIGIDGCIKDGFGNHFNCLLDPVKDILRCFSMMWDAHLHSLISHRKGCGQHRFNFDDTCRIFTSFDDREQKLLALNFVGGFQTEGTKAKWLNECDAKCPLCDAVDTHAHRMFDCPKLRAARDMHPEAVQFLHDNPDWMYHPFLYTHRDEPTISRILSEIDEVSLQHVIPTPAETHVYYTDGSCVFPEDRVFRRASWAVIRQFDGDENNPFYECVLLGCAHGRQTISRAELIAVERACKLAVKDVWCKVVIIYTDSQYVANVLKNLDLLVNSPYSYRTANIDILRSIAEVWNLKIFCIKKAKSHRSLLDATSNDDLFRILGNNTADKAANAAQSLFPSVLRTLTDDVREHYATQQHKLKLVLRYYIDFTRLRFELTHNKSSLDSAMVRSEQPQDIFRTAMGEDALKFMQEYQLSEVKVLPCDDADISIFHANLQGSCIGWLVFNWARTIRWPDVNDLKIDTLESPITEWGISVFELLVNFCIVTATYFPIRASGTAGTSIFINYDAPEALLLPHSKRSAGMQIRSLLACISCLETITGQTLMPTFKQTGFSSLRRLGINAAITGWAGRPVLLKQHETMSHVCKYISALNGSSALSLPLDCVEHEPLVSVPPGFVEDFTAHQRYCAYLRLRKAAT